MNIDMMMRFKKMEKDIAMLLAERAALLERIASLETKRLGRPPKDSV